MRNHILHAWGYLDPIYQKAIGLTTIESEETVSIFRVRLIRYRGPKHILSNGDSINNGDLLIKLHLHNINLLRMLAPIKSSIKKTFLLYRIVEQALPLLAVYIRKHPLQQQIKAIYGVTMLNFGVQRLGFEKKPVTNYFYRTVKSTSQLSIHYLSTGSISRLRKKKEMYYLFMSKDRLLKTV